MQTIKQLWQAAYGWVMAQWLQIPIDWRKEITSIWHTFLTVFILQISIQIKAGQIPMTHDALVSLVTAASRSAIKAVWEALFISGGDDSTGTSDTVADGSQG